MSRKSRRLRRRRTMVGHYTKPGAAPGVPTIDPDAHPSALTVYGYGLDGFEEHELEDPAGIGDFLGKWPVTWVHVEGLGDTRMIYALGERFGLHQLSLEDVIHTGQRPKLEVHSEYLSLTVRLVKAGHPIFTEQLSIFFGKNFVLTFQETPGSDFEPVIRRIKEGAGRIRDAGPDYLAYSLLDAVADHYFPVVDTLEARLEALEDKIFNGSGHDSSVAIHDVKSQLRILRRSVFPMRESLETLLSTDLSMIEEASRVYLRDCHDHVMRIGDIVFSLEDYCSDLMNLHLSMMSHRMNEAMRVLTVFASIFIPITFIAGVYGMNFNPGISIWNMPELNWRWGYPFALALMASTALGLLVYFRRKRWF